MIDPDDLRPIRVMVFPQRPDVLLVYVPEGQELWLPRLPTPFDRFEVARVLGDAEVKARVAESTLGRFATAFEKAFLDAQLVERAQNAQRQRELEAAKRVEILHSPTATTTALKRIALIEEKLKVDEEIRQLKTLIGRAKADVVSRGVYQDPVKFRRNEKRLADLQTMSLAMQAELGQLKKQLAAENVAIEAARKKSPKVSRNESPAEREERNRTDAVRFVEAARKTLSRESYLAIWAEANKDVS